MINNIFTVETPLIGFDGGDLEEPLPLTSFDGEEPLALVGEPERAGLGSVATAKNRLIRFGTGTRTLVFGLAMELRRRASIPLETSCGAASIGGATTLLLCEFAVGCGLWAVGERERD